MFKKVVAIPAALFAAALLMFAMTLHPLRSQFAAVQTFAGTAGGSVNALTLTVPNMGSLNDIIGVPITFFPSGTNTGPVTINISSFGNVNARRPSGFGTLVAFSSGELNANVLTSIVYDGTNLNLVGPVNPAPIASVLEGRFATAPNGYLLEDGSCISRTTYAPLFASIATTYGACDGSTTFGLPDSRGTAVFALDNQGANGAANRLTSASGCTATSLVSTVCGGQTSTLGTANLPAYTPSGTISGSVGSSSTSTTTGTIAQQGFAQTGTQVGTGTSYGSNNGGLNQQNWLTLSTSTVTSSTFSGSFAGSPQGGSSTAFGNVPPASLVRRAIKF